MKTIFRIAQTELRLFFYSPIAWLILIIFAFQAGMAFCDTFGYQLQNKALGRGQIPFQTVILLLGENGAFFRVLSNLYLYIPLLTMALMSREYSSGSVKLLYSSPVTEVQIIGGKFLSMMLYGGLMLGILVLQVVFAFLFVKNLDIPLVLSGLLGIYLVLCAYSAIGLFMSALTSYQIVAAVGTLVVLTFLNFVGGLWQDIPVVQEITWWLSLSGRAKTFTAGLICSEDVVYFLVVTGLFLTCSVLKLQADRRPYSWWRQGVRYGGAVCLALGIGYLTSRPWLMSYYDTTETEHNTITREGQRVMKQIGDRLTITMYVNLLDKSASAGMPENQMANLRELQPFLRFKPDTRLEYVYFYDSTDHSRFQGASASLPLKEQMLKVCDNEDLDPALFLSPEEIRRQIDLTAEGNRMIYLLERENGRKSFLRFYDGLDIRPRETEITAALKRLVDDAPKIVFTTGHGERSLYWNDKGGMYSLIQRNGRNALVNQGFDVDTLNLTGRTAIPGDIDMLVIAAPEEKFSPREQELLDSYIARGGNLIVAGEPGHRELMNGLVKSLGIAFKEGTVLQHKEADWAEDFIVGDIAASGVRQTGIGAGMLARQFRAVFPGTMALSFDAGYGFQGVPVTEYAGDTLMLALNRKLGETEQRIIVSGDADWFSTEGLALRKEGVQLNNFGLFMEMLHYMTYQRFPVDNSRPSPTDDTHYLDVADMKWIKGLFVGLIPLLLAGWGIGFRLRRKRQ